MFEAVELGRTASKEEYKARVPGLRTELLEIQNLLRQHAPFPVIVVFAGVDGAGKSETVNLLSKWMDPRWLVVRAFGAPSNEEKERPEFWRYWHELPPRGRIALFLSSWYSAPLLDRVFRRLKEEEFERQLDRIAAFERTLADDGAVILKFWMHLGKAAQKKRLKKLERDPLTRWRVTRLQWKHWRMYDKFIAAAERILERTSTDQAPWTIVEGEDERYRSLTVGTMLRDAMARRLTEIRGPAKRSRSVKSARRSKARAGAADRRTVLERLDMSRKIEKAAFSDQLERWQGRLNLLQRRARDQGISTVMVFEGWDAAGKGGAIRRVTGALDAPTCRVVPIAAPTDEERVHHYLWRFWKQLPSAGMMTIFDRSWYGRVLVERVEGLAAPAEWLRAYTEINQFEEQLVEHGLVLVKFWLHITPDEQLRRFRERGKSAYKRWKLTDEDWRNRKKREDYAGAVNDMIERTSTRLAPWTLVGANNKYYARIKVIETCCARLESALD
jgi:polyphosphate:AMP phosphotransferase